ncbi:hypothetical protein BGZ65_005772 [Modicella reniformis]|uniref:Uncharacterized protein n=1 Tax=Modicella reniformis TaxID=1440133 RepID=A0A9P6MB96_9FUNG|nr:hypothetical protein BGZ65_005772 [Modicella reniformis]
MQTWFIKRTNDDIVISPTVHADDILECYLWFVREVSSDDQRYSEMPDEESVESILSEEEDRRKKRRKGVDDDWKPPSRLAKVGQKIQKVFTRSRRQKSEAGTRTRHTVIPAFSNLKLIASGERARTYSASWQAGVANGMEMILVTDFVGTSIIQEHLDSSDRAKIRTALSKIHELGVLHVILELRTFLSGALI